MKKITLLITRLDRGGSADLTLQLAKGLSQRGYKVLLIAGKTTNPDRDLTEYAEKNNFRLKFISPLRRDINIFFDLKAFYRIYETLINYKPDILHTNSSKAGFLGRIAGKIAGVSDIYHSPHGHIFYGYHSKIVSKAFIILEKFAAKFSTKIFNLTEQGKKDHIQENIGPPQKFKVSSCGVDLSPFEDITPLSSNKNSPFTLCWIGRFVSIKNPEMFIRAIHEIDSPSNKFNYRMIGNGPLLPKIKKQAERLNLNNLHFEGYKNNIIPFLLNSDIFILTSKNEGFGRVIVEAMAAGLPIIATSVGGVPDLITQGKNGLLVPSNDYKKLRQAILKLYNSKDLYNKISQRNIREAQKYTIDNYINNIEIIYNG